MNIDADIRRAETLPAWFYRDPEVFAWAREQLFARSWQLAPDADAVKVPQQVHPFLFLEGCVDEPLLLTRTAADEVFCLSNVCTHRANLVAAEPCRTAHLRCPYHGRRFALDGRFQHMPEFDDAEGFPRAADDLPRVPLERLGVFQFTAIDPMFTFDELTGDMRERIAGMPVDACVFDAGRSRDYLVQANWVLYCENYLEGFHIPFVHPSLNAVLDYGAYRTELFPYANVQIGVAGGGEHLLDLAPGTPEAGESIAGYYFWLFPNLMFNVYPWGISVNIVRPLAVNRTKVSFRTYVWDESRLDAGAGAGLDRVEREDENVVESVQRGIGSRLYQRGRYSPTREQGVHQFHRLLAGFWNAHR